MLAASSLRTAMRPIALRRAVMATSRGMATVGDQLPSVDLHIGFPPQKHNLADFAKNKKIILLGLPGACTLSSRVFFLLETCTDCKEIVANLLVFSLLFVVSSLFFFSCSYPHLIHKANS
jgi:hypothetical protein